MTWRYQRSSRGPVSQEPQLAFEGGRGFGAAGDRNMNEAATQAAYTGERLVDELFVVVSIRSEGEPG